MDIKKLLQQKTELAEIWNYLAIAAEFPDKQMRLWLHEHGMQQVQAAIELLAKREHDVTDPVKYLGKVLHNSKLQNMTVEERQEKISTLATLAGKVRAAKEHEKKVKAIKQEFADSLLDSVGLSLQSAEVPLYSAAVRSIPAQSALGVGVGVGSGFDGVSDGGNGAVPDKTKSVASLPSPHLDGKKEQTKTNHAGASGISANQGKTGKTKTAKNGKPYPPGFDSWTNVERTEWLLCTCEEPAPFTDFRHDPACPVCPKVTAAAANDFYVEPL